MKFKLWKIAGLLVATAGVFMAVFALYRKLCAIDSEQLTGVELVGLYGLQIICLAVFMACGHALAEIRRMIF